jgi:hypothetical protein
MTANEIHTRIKELQNISSSNEKKKLLKETQDDLFKKYLQYVYDEVNYVYGKNKLPMVKKGTDDNDQQLVELFKLLDKFNSGELRGKKGDQAIEEYLDNKDSIYHDLLFWIIKRDIKAKIGSRLINDAYGESLITLAPYMRCESEKYLEKRIKYPALIQTKADGLFCNIFFKKDNQEIEVTTRKGKKIPIFENTVFNALKEIIFNNYQIKEDFVLHGELLLIDSNDKIMAREVGNGLINKYVKAEGTQSTYIKKLQKAKSEQAKSKIENEIQQFAQLLNQIADDLVFIIWDYVPLKDFLNTESKMTTEERFEKVKEIFSIWENLDETPYVEKNRFQLIDYQIVNSYDEAIAFYKQQLQKGLEGAVIKNLDAPWVNDVNRFGIVKMKEFKEADLLIVGWKSGEEHSEFQDGIGSLICESSCGNLKVEVSGLTHEQRGFRRKDQNDSSQGLELIPDFNLDQYTGKIAAVKFNSVIKSKSQQHYSLFLPSLVEIRDASDKSEADDLQKILSL